MLAQLFILYFGLTEIGIRFTPVQAAILGLGFNGGAYLAEVFRAGIQSIHAGQMEAALTVGMTPLAAMRYVVLPQALNVVVPPTTNYSIALLKDTAIVSAVAAPEIMFKARNLVMETYLSAQIYLLVALMYLVMSLILAYVSRRLERRLAVSGASGSGETPRGMSEMVAVYEEHLAEWLPQLIEAAGNTLRMTALAFVLAFVVGLLLALAKLSPIAPLRLFATGYIEVMRGIPSLAILFLIYFGLADFGLIFDAFPAAVIGFGLNGAAYMAEIFRAGILSIHGGQMEAALTVGMTPLSAMRWVILPQALRVVLPPLANFGIALLKDTSVASIISAPELMLRARDLASSSFLPMEVFLLAAAIYLAMSLPIAFLTRRLEARFSRGQAHV